MGVTITSPAAGATISGTITVTATVDGGSFRRASLYVDGVFADATTSEPISFIVNTLDFPDGGHELKVVADYNTEEAAVTPTVKNGGGGNTYWGALLDGKQTYTVYYGDPAPNGQPWQSAPWGAAGNTWDRFEQNVGKKASLLMYGQPPPWRQTKWYGSTADVAVDRGAVPMLSMQPGNEKLIDLANGKYDAQWKTWLDQVKAWGKPLLFRWAWEMNGNWFAWGQAQPAADYVACWKHYYDLAKSRGVTNLTWVWCANVNPAGYPYEPRFPGVDYVDWTGLDGYNKARTSRPAFDIFNSGYQKLLELAPSKPIVICETSSLEYGGGVKGPWINDLLNTQLPQAFPKVRAVCWFNWRYWDSGRAAWCEFPVSSTDASRAAFKDAIAHPRYMAAGQQGLPPGQKVPPPS